MIMGHYAMALVPHAKIKSFPLWGFLIISQLLDFVMLFLIAFGVESIVQNPEANQGMFAATINMMYSHDIVPVIVIGLIVAGVLFVATKRQDVAIWAFLLVIFHEVSDLLSGFSHNVFGPETTQFGFDFYNSNVLLALAIEIAISMACVHYFFKVRKGEYTKKRRLLTYAVVVVPTLAFLIQNYFLIYW